MFNDFKQHDMKQMNVEESIKVNVDFTATGIPANAKKLEPLVYKDGDLYCCLLGPNPEEGIFGCGDNTELALADWEKHLTERLATSSVDDPVSQYVKDVLKADDTEVW